MLVTAILNPQAKNGRAGRAAARISRLFEKEGMDAVLVCTEGPGHGIALAREAAMTSDAVVAIGGDGTVHEVANGIIESGKPAVMGILPFGTGNDFVKMTGTPRKLESAMRVLASGKRKAVDYGTLTYHSESAGGRRHFINTAGIGFDAEVGLRASSFKSLPGFTAYLAAVVGALRHLKISESRVEIYGPDEPASWYQGSLLLGTFGNGQYSGGLFRLTPQASINDGWLDVGVIERVSTSRILSSIPSVLRGTHTDMIEFHATRARRVSIYVEPGLPAHADGEILSTRVRRLDVQIVQNGLTVIVP